jgi:5-(carboxyamino)imidazole ribonucleotide mutase
MAKPVIGIIMGSRSDLSTVNETIKILKDFKVGFEAKVLSAHRSPRELMSYVEAAPKRGIKVFIAAAGGAAALAGVIASHSPLPVIGVPVETKALQGIDSLLSTVQMPSGVPVACVTIGKTGAKNAAYLALEILGLSDNELQQKIICCRKKQAKQIGQIKLKV